ncbi:RDD family protein [Corynebacterium mendelii]|uniref:RDD family protein n=1 Tax=Corynebacterium mendelii TaxID=2765362 RepID=A0A939E016_9CORY|nr:RDD family protein [Corynebacterium mendelii]MBN9643047.1 RDD family protein [Corynebacterium mendelii]
MRDRDSSWLDGPRLAGEGDDDPTRPARWPGEKIGLPQRGAGSLASIVRRVGGLLLDWVIAQMVALIISGFAISDFFNRSLTDAAFNGAVSRFNEITMVAYFVIGVITVVLFARTPGQAIMKMGVARVDQPDQRVGLWRAVVRTALTLLVLPPVITDSDGRGIHDRLTRTAVILG